jgi:hypothetical protein
MSLHPINLILRFQLEIAALVAVGYWGFATHTGLGRVLFGILLPAAIAVAWAVLAVPGDRARSGLAPLPVPGALRLLLELAFFAFAAWALYDAGRPLLATILAGVTLVHYALSYDRVAWLMRHTRTTGA